MDSPPKNIMKIAVIVPHRPFFGNILTQLPLFQALRTLYPKAHITVWSKTAMSQLIIDNGAADQLILYKKLNFFSLLKKFRKEAYQHIYNINPGSEKMHMISLFSRALKKNGISSSKWPSRFYDKHLLINKGDHYIALNLLALINHAHGCKFKPSIIKTLASPITAQSKSITFLPGGGAGDYKRWSIENYCNVYKDISQKFQEYKAVFILGPQEVRYKSTIEAELIGLNFDIIEAPTVKEIITIAQQSTLTLANDCGPMHLFQMLEVPLITIWGSKEGGSPFKTLSEWFYSTENAIAIVPNDEFRNIHSIPSKKVSAMALMLMKQIIYA